MSISKRLIELRNTLGLTRKKFCEEIGVSIRTIEGIENGGNTPRSDLVEKIVKKWPEFGLWLISGSLEFRSEQTCPNIIHKKQINIVESCDPKFITHGLISTRLIEDSEITFIQNLGNPSQLAAILKLEETTVYALNSTRLKDGFIWLNEGVISFDKSIDGRNYLRSLREKLSTLNEEIISSSKYKGLSPNDFELAKNQGVILFESLQNVQDNELLKSFEEWKKGGNYIWPENIEYTTITR